jgi:hypothetical protein
MISLPADIIRHYIRTRGIRNGLQQWAKRAYLRKTTNHSGVNIFDTEWDALVILDACRPDLFDHVADDYDWIESTETRPSVGTATMHWMNQTFSEVDDEVLKNTVYVCANPFSGRLLDAGQFDVLEEVWKWGWDDDAGTVPPRPVTDAAISLSRECNPDRFLVHYMQPHVPFLDSPKSPKLTMENFDGSGDRPLDDWELIEIGERSEAEVWDDYRSNLKTVLDDVSLLRENIEAEHLVITSDHGNAVGEHGLYGHPGGVSIPALYEVPWCETESIDTGNYEPSKYEKVVMDEDIESKLRTLGYID